MNELTPADAVEEAASALPNGQRLIRLHRLHDEAPTDEAMMMGIDILHFINDSGLVTPGLYPDIDDNGGLSMEWALRTPSGEYDIINLIIPPGSAMMIFRLPAGRVNVNDKYGMDMDDVREFLVENIPTKE